MRKVLSIFTIVALAACTTGIAFADPTPPIADATWVADNQDGVQTYAGSVTTAAGAGAVLEAFSASMKLIADDSDVNTGVTWNAVTPGTTGWLAANQYLEIEGYANHADWGIQIYTDNANSATVPYTGSGNPAGLVRADNAIYSLDMCWRVNKEAFVAGAQELGINEGTSGAYSVLYDNVPGHAPGVADDTADESDYFPWFYMLDKGTPDCKMDVAGNQAFGNYQPESTFVGSLGYHPAPGGQNYFTPYEADTYFVYLGANFAQAVHGKTYSTDTITVEMYHL